jgi:hypothetical protein
MEKYLANIAAIEENFLKKMREELESLGRNDLEEILGCMKNLYHIDQQNILNEFKVPREETSDSITRLSFTLDKKSVTVELCGAEENATVITMSFNHYDNDNDYEIPCVYVFICLSKGRYIKIFFSRDYEEDCFSDNLYPDSHDSHHLFENKTSNEKVTVRGYSNDGELSDPDDLRYSWKYKKLENSDRLVVSEAERSEYYPW